jgi:hypothetical protein
MVIQINKIKIIFCLVTYLDSVYIYFQKIFVNLHDQKY